MNAPTYELGDWFSNNVPNWKAWLAEMAGARGLEVLELGSCEGRSAIWLLQNVVTDKSAMLTCVDIEIRDRLRKNVEAIGRTLDVVFVEETTTAYLLECEELQREFDMIYVDASHHARDVLSDAVRAWAVLTPGGILIFDDYLLCENPLAQWDRPGPAIDAFLSAYRSEIEVLPDVPHAINPGWQKAVRKRA